MEKRNRHSRKVNLSREEWEIPYPSEKRCSTCKEVLPAIAFPKAKAEKDGLKTRCKSCESNAQKEKYKANPAKRKASTVRWQAKNPDKVKVIARRTYYKNQESRISRNKKAYHENKGQILAKSRAAYAADASRRERVQAQSIKYYEANREKRINYQKQYKIDNPESATFWSNTRRCRMKNAAGSYTKQEWADRLEEFGYCCAYCLQHGSVVGSMSIDHMTPLSKGGTNEIDNLVPSCRRCNSSKNKKDLLEFLAFKHKTQTAFQ